MSFKSKLLKGTTVLSLGRPDAPPHKTDSGGLVALFAEAITSVPEILLDNSDRLMTVVLEWYTQHYCDVASALYLDESVYTVGRCEPHDIYHSAFREIGIVPVGMPGSVANWTDPEEAIHNVTSALDVLLCHTVTHSDVLILDGVLMHGMLQSETFYERHAYYCMWTLLALRHSGRTTDCLDTVVDLSELAVSYESNNLINFDSVFCQLRKLRKCWQRSSASENKYPLVLENISIDEGCCCGSTRWTFPTNLNFEGPAAYVSLMKCSRSKGHCRWKCSVVFGEWICHGDNHWERRKVCKPPGAE